MYADLIEIFTQFSHKTGRNKKTSRNSKKNKNEQRPWYSTECRRLKNSLNRQEKKFRKNLFDRNAQQNLINARKEFKSICKKSEKRFRDKLSNKLLEAESANPQEFWKTISQMRNWGKPAKDNSEGIPPREWHAYFTELFRNKEDLPEQILANLKRLEEEPVFTELSFRIQNHEIGQAFKKLNQKASPGVDKVSAKILYAGRKELTPILNLFLNKTFSEVGHPSVWATNILKTILKKGIASDPDNYRGIAIGSCIAKLFSLVLLGRLEKFVFENKLISQNQIGFKKGHRTADHVFVLSTIINKIVKVEKKRLYTAFIDFRKAYDHINRTLLFTKLQKMGIQGLFYENIKRIYESTYYMTKVKGGYLNPIKSQLGLLQGGILSPILFNLYIDDIKNSFDENCDPINLYDEEVSHLLYADDLIILSKTEHGLRQSLKNLETYCRQWKLQINITKTKILIFNSSGRKLKSDNYIFQGKKIDITDSYCYLGVNMTPSGSFQNTQKVLKEKAQKAMFPLYSVISQFSLSPTRSLNMFQTFIKPIALYNSENWATLSEHKIQSIRTNKSSLIDYIINSEPDMVVKKFLKFILGVNKNTSTIAIFGESGQTPLLLQGFVSLLKFWHRITNLPVHLPLIEEKQSDWLRTVNFLMKYIGMQDATNNPNVMSVNEFDKECKKRLIKKFTYEWKSKLKKEGSKLKLYDQIKHIFGKEKYLDDVVNYSMRKIITKFRCSDHKLEIEVGRHKKIPQENRVCRQCPNDIETELHFICSCPSYKKLRKKHFNSETIDTQLGKNILACKQKTTSLKLGSYLMKAVKVRDEILKQ